MHSAFYRNNVDTPLNTIEKHKKALDTFINQLENGTFANSSFLQKIGPYAPYINAADISAYDLSDKQVNLKMKLLGLFRTAVEALLIIQTIAAVRYNTPGYSLNKYHLEALLSIPAITNDWGIITQHPAFYDMDHGQCKRLNEILQQLANEKNQEVVRLQNATNNIYNLMEAIRDKPVPELAEIKRHFSCISGAESIVNNNSHFEAICKLIANSYNMVETFKQALAVAENNLPRSEYYLEIMKSWTDVNELENVMKNFCPPGTRHVYT